MSDLYNELINFFSNNNNTNNNNIKLSNDIEDVIKEADIDINKIPQLREIAFELYNNLENNPRNLIRMNIEIAFNKFKKDVDNDVRKFTPICNKIINNVF